MQSGVKQQSANKKENETKEKTEADRLYNRDISRADEIYERQTLREDRRDERERLDRLETRRMTAEQNKMQMQLEYDRLAQMNDCAVKTVRTKLLQCYSKV